ncbi:MAG TPA: pyridoxal-phosphate dependent enzyme, partial [Ferruginibacter sp.]|nr:pyridoxal-phosphate dependent enzyme [Ferruginibacter sp.]
MLPDYNNIVFERLQATLLDEKSIRLTIARLDKIHPVLSGNKIFKLYYFIQEALASSHKTVCTFGGAYSNHLVATAYACREAGLKSIGYVRGDEGIQSHTITACKGYGMELRFIKRDEYYGLQAGMKPGPFILIPEGGYHPTGAKGAALIMKSFAHLDASYICTPVGTATTAAGLIQNRRDHEIVLIPVIKNMTDLEKRIYFLNSGNTTYQPLVLDEYHFGGYAKKNGELLDFMNNLYNTFNLATDFVYTAKMMFAVFDRIKMDYFPRGSHIVCL